MASEKFGELSREKDGYQVVFERTLSHSAMAVWDAITNPAKLSKWFFEVELELKPGARMIIRFRDEHNTETYGKVVTVVPGSLFEFIWEGSDGEPDEFARWEIFPESATRTRLVLTYSRLTEKYAAGAPAGFHIFLDQLEEYLAEERHLFQITAVRTLSKSNYKASIRNKLAR
jgi:uncharacterized protein YndB with AHSA1/START domain